MVTMFKYLSFLLALVCFGFITLATSVSFYDNPDVEILLWIILGVIGMFGPIEYFYEKIKDWIYESMKL